MPWIKYLARNSTWQRILYLKGKQGAKPDFSDGEWGIRRMDIPIHTIIKTERLLLRYPRLDDAAQIFSVVRSSQFPEQLPLKEMNSEKEIKNWLKRLQEGWATGQVFSWMVEDLDSGKLLGQMTLSKIGGDNQWAMAFWIHPDQQGKGFATEGAERLLAFGFETVGAELIRAGAGDWNKGSCRVMEKIGMIFRGINPAGYYSKGEPILTREYEISRERWQLNNVAPPSRQMQPTDWNLK